MERAIPPSSLILSLIPSLIDSSFHSTFFSIYALLLFAGIAFPVITMEKTVPFWKFHFTFYHSTSLSKKKMSKKYATNGVKSNPNTQILENIVPLYGKLWKFQLKKHEKSGHPSKCPFLMSTKYAMNGVKNGKNRAFCGHPK